MRSMRVAALAVAMTLMFSGLAMARDHDDHKRDHRDSGHWDKKVDRHQVSNHVWDHDWKRDRANNRVSSDHHWWERSRERANDGYYGGSQVYNRYPTGGYGYPSGGYGYPSSGGGYGYPNGGYGYPGGGGGYGYPGSVGRGGYGGGGGSGAGYNQGMQDGSYQARKDISEGKPFNPYPRGSSHSDHGYHSDMGDKHVYQASYDQGYQSGYQSNYGGRGRRGGF